MLLLSSFKKRLLKPLSRILFIVLWVELLAPVQQAMALTSGPTTPEMKGFEPIGTTDMVNTFSGDFVYNLPLFDIEGYPVNMSYHSGVGMEDEASWVGLGWSLNTGQINRGVRGIPDDYNGEEIHKRLHIAEEMEYVFSSGVGVGWEIAGFARLGLGTDVDITYNNYKGYGVGISLGVNLKTSKEFTPYGGGIGLNVGINSLSGADINGTLSLSISNIENTNAGGSINGGTGFNSRYGMKDPNMGISVFKTKNHEIADKYKKNAKGSSVEATIRNTSGLSTSSTIPIGLQNFTPSLTHSIRQTGYAFSVQYGSEVMFNFPHFQIGMSYTKTDYEPNGTKRAFGYLNLQNADRESVLDFTRDKDGAYNETHASLPTSALSYDIFSVNGQGTGGMFRPFRSDLGSIYDPEIVSKTNQNSSSIELGTPIGPVGGLLEAGVNHTLVKVNNKSGAGHDEALYNNLNKFKKQEIDRNYENVFFKNGGELTYNRVADAPQMNGLTPLIINGKTMSKDGGISFQNAAGFLEAKEERTPRATTYNYLTQAEASISGIGMMPSILKYPINTATNLLQRAPDSVKRMLTPYFDKMKADHIGEFYQTMPDGRRYVYGLPAVNNIQREATFSVEDRGVNLTKGTTTFGASNDKIKNGVNKEQFFQVTVNPAHAYAYLLTAVLSPDYIDVTGDGPTEDDIGNYTRFNYTRTDSNFRWISPYSLNGDLANYHPGHHSDKNDDKASYITGAKEVWYVSTIESKNQIAEFYISKRNDARGTKAAVIKGTDELNASNLYDQNLLNPTTEASNSYRLDSVSVYSKNDRFINGTNAVPIKTVIFQYDYSLCQGVPNNLNGGGKLTLKRVYVKNGSSNISLLNPYKFTYSSNNANYDLAYKDRWGDYKPQTSNATNLPIYDFPYTTQNKALADLYTANWHLTQIDLPSGGKLDITYESDDYSYVQNKRAMEMAQIAGVGNTANFTPTDVLYNTSTDINNYVYIKRDTVRESKVLTLAENYLDGENLLYFSARVDIGNKSKYEHIKGYALVEDIGVCQNNTSYLYIKLKGEVAGPKTSKRIHPITLAALNYAKLSLPQLIYPGYKDESSSTMRAILDGLSGAFEELGHIFKNQNLFLIEERGLCKRILPEHSWVRTQTPGYTKLGGGNRVKSVVLSDNWNKMTQSYTSTYGKQYDYSTVCERTGERISSGVAINEPAIGGDENPLRQPEPYTAQSGRLMPAIKLYKETPHAESYLPSASIGYSKITVQSIHVEDAKSSKYESVEEYYTAKDFPVRIEQTPIKEYKKIDRKTFTYNETSKSVGQGYTVIMNDMHGKLKKNADYVIRTTGSTAHATREEISSQMHIYQTDNNGNLFNKVKALMPPDATNSSYRIIDNISLGEEIDLNHDVRYNNSKTFSIGGKINLNVVNFAFVTVPLPSFFSIPKTKEIEFTSQVTTKFVQQYGILKKVITHNHGAKVEQENLLYDGQSGQTLHTITNNEYKDKINVLNVPAYLAHHYMGPSYVNEGMMFSADTMHIRGYQLYVKPKSGTTHFKEGDELMVDYVHGLDTSKKYVERFWVVGTGGLPSVNSNIPDNSNCNYLILERRREYYITYIGYPPGVHPFYKDVVANVIRSGNRNMINTTMQSTTYLGNKTVNTLNDFLNITVADKIINTSVSRFDNTAEQNITNAPGHSYFPYNVYVSGMKGNVKARSSYVYNSSRSYSDHARYEGSYTDYVSFWELIGAPTSSCGMYRNYMKPKSGAVGKWMLGDSVLKYNSYNLPTETRTNTGVISSGQYGYNFNLPLIVGQNASQKELVYYGFEDDNILKTLRMQHDGMQTTYPSYAIRAEDRNNLPPLSWTQYARYGREFFAYNSDYYYPGYKLSTNAHTGNHSITVEDKTKRLFVANVNQLVNGRGYTLSFWIKNPDLSKPSLGQVIIRCIQTSNNTYVNSPHSILNIVTGPIDGWYKVEAKLSSPLPNIPNGYEQRNIELTFATNGQLIDDIRLAPSNAACVAYVYSPITMRMMAMLDNNNYATFYEYDAEGNMIRTKKETDRGILTINENRKSLAK